MNILEENWDKIRQKVIIPLWHGKFKYMYESVKLDYDDFESLAGVELTKAFKIFDSEKSNIFTFSARVINQKAITELRNCTQRDKRKALYISESVDALDNSIIEHISYNTANEISLDFNLSEDDLSDKMKKYLGRLSKLQREILFALSDGYTNEEIIVRFKINAKEMAEAYSTIKAYRNVSILF